MSTILSVFFVKAHQNMGNINLVLGLAIKILEQIEKPPTSPPKPHYPQFDSVRRGLTVLSKALQKSKAISTYQGAKYIDGKR